MADDAEDRVDDSVEGEGEEEDDLDALLDMADEDVGQLSNVAVKTSVAPSLDAEVTTVNRQKSTVGRSPAAVFVISNEMIRRSGARSIPDVLRMAPGVSVARIDANKWAISIRGSTGRFANKLLVQIDGRTVYTPLFGGVFWDVQDVLLEDVERIEVVRGPGASVWGAYYVNGVINIITKSAADTHGLFAEGGSGAEERGFSSARYGWRTAGGIDMRVYGKWFERDEGYLPGGAAHDDWRSVRSGFRADWRPDCDSQVTFQGDYYDGASGQEQVVPDFTSPFSRSVVDDANVEGGNALLRYSRDLDEESGYTIQMFYDRTERHYQSYGFREDRDTIDVDFQHNFKRRDAHSILWGAGYRNTRDHIQDAPNILSFDPSSRADDLFSYFIQDEVTLSEDRLYLTLAAKFAHSDYTPFEFQPTVRLLWAPTDRHSAWASYSRAVRLPARADSDVRITRLSHPSAPGILPFVQGDPAIASENLDAWEAGLRGQPADHFSWDLAAFYFDYSDLHTIVPGTPFFDPGPPAATYFPTTLSSEENGRSYGYELSTNYEIDSNWRLFGAYTYLQEEVSDKVSRGESPNNQLYLQSSWDLTCRLQLDGVWRYVDSLGGQGTPSYNTMDVRLSWRRTNNMELTLVGRNLLDTYHAEFAPDDIIGNVATNVEREVYGVLTLRY